MHLDSRLLRPVPAFPIVFVAIGNLAQVEVGNRGPGLELSCEMHMEMCHILAEK